MSSVGVVCAAALLAGCGGSGPSEVAGESSGSFPLAVSSARFPASQRLSEHTTLVISVRNAGHRTVPDVAVTLTNPRYGTAAQAFGTLIPGSQAGQPVLASRSRPVWVVDQAPGPCSYSCHQDGPGGAATAYSNTWALGKLAPGQTARFTWHVTAVLAGRYTVHYEVAAGLSSKAVAVSTGRLPLAGSFAVDVSGAPRQAYVNNAGQIIYGHQ